MASLTDRVAIVTGGGDGIGRATALLLSQEGAKVVVADVAMDAARRVAEGNHAAKTRCSAAYDGRDAQWRHSRDMVQECLRQWGRIDILVNIVGGSFPMPVMEMEEVEWERVVNLNLKSVYLCCGGVLPAMTRKTLWKDRQPGVGPGLHRVRNAGQLSRRQAGRGRFFQITRARGRSPGHHRERRLTGSGGHRPSALTILGSGMARSEFLPTDGQSGFA